MKIAVILLVCCLVALGAEAKSKHKDTHHASEHAEGGGHGAGVEHHDAHKHLAKSGKKSQHEHEKSSKGKAEVVSHKVSDEEHGGKKGKSHSSAGHAASKKAEGHSAHAGKFEEGAKHKKTGYEKGFREVYHKDEHKKKDSFYSNGHKSGEYHIFGNKGSKHQSEKYGKSSHGKHIATKSADRYSKQMKKAGGHKTADDKAYKHEGGSKSHYAKHEKTVKRSPQKKHNGDKYKYVSFGRHV